MKETVITIVLLGFFLGIISPYIIRFFRKWKIEKNINDILKIESPINRLFAVRSFLKDNYNYYDFESGFLPDKMRELSQETLAKFLSVFLFEQVDEFFEGTAYWIGSHWLGNQLDLIKCLKKYNHKAAERLKNSLYYLEIE